MLLFLVLVAGIGIAGKLYLQYGNSAYSVEVTSYHISDRSVTVVLDVTKPAGRPAACGVIANSFDGARVGTATVRVPPGTADQTRATVTYTLPTTARAYAIQVPRCAAPATG